SIKFAAETSFCLFCGLLSHIDTMRSVSLNGSRRNSTAFTILKMAVLAPMASASVETAINVKPCSFTNIREQERRSGRNVRRAPHKSITNGRLRDWSVYRAHADTFTWTDTRDKSATHVPE